MTKAFWEGLKESSADAPWMKKVTLDTAFRDINMPLHPGAAKYYKEIGLKIPDGIMPK